METLILSYIFKRSKINNIRFILANLFFVSITQLSAQDENLISVVNVAFNHPKVSEKIYFDYAAVGQPPYVLPKGRYAFIVPDTTFQKAYPDILEKLSLSWGIEGKLGTITFSIDSMSSIFVTSSFDDNILVRVRFELIEIKDDQAKLIFSITSIYYKDSLRDRYIKSSVSLKKKKTKWVVNSVRIIKTEPKLLSSDFDKG